MLKRGEIEDLLPHGRGMVMLDTVLSCDDTSIICEIRNHQMPSHPLRVDGRLSALVGVEYAAQSMALHEALTRNSGGATARPGRLVGLRRVKVLAETLDEHEGELIVTANLLVGQGDVARYAFEISHDDAPILQGQALLLLLMKS